MSNKVRAKDNTKRVNVRHVYYTAEVVVEYTGTLLLFMTRRTTYFMPLIRCRCLSPADSSSTLRFLRRRPDLLSNQFIRRSGKEWCASHFKIGDICVVWFATRTLLNTPMVVHLLPFLPSSALSHVFSTRRNVLSPNLTESNKCNKGRIDRRPPSVSSLNLKALLTSCLLTGIVMPSL